MINPGIKLIIGLFLLSFIACSSVEQNPEYVKEINNWHKERIENLKRPTGWLSLVGLHWLKEGKNSFGSSKTNDIVMIDKLPAKIGTIILQEGKLTVELGKESGVLIDSAQIFTSELKTDADETPTIMSYGSLNWYIIKRGENRYGIRAKDSENDLRVNFPGIERYPVDEKWKIDAKYIRYAPPKKISVPSAIGTVSEDLSPGKLVFNIGSKEYELDAMDSGDQLFIVFADQTNGETTYGAGRFLVVDKPQTGELTKIDFNMAYNPPCGFTHFATCPLPPKNNMMKVKIEAGEKAFAHSHH